MVELLGFFELFPEFGQAQAVSGARLVVEHLTGIAQAADMNAGFGQILFPVRQPLLCLERCGLNRALNQVQNVELHPWMAEQAGDVKEPFGLPQARDFLPEGDCPVLALLAENAPFVQQDAGHFLR